MEMDTSKRCYLQAATANLSESHSFFYNHNLIGGELNEKTVNINYLFILLCL
jgi:hypothetical protein